ncbi:MAG: DUF378 domain-containing protein [Candidatus Gracilibacteria bacterium]
MKCCAPKWICNALVLVGALNWGLVGFFSFNLVEKLLGSWPMAITVTYDLVGVAAVLCVVHYFACPCDKGDEKGGCCGKGACKK